MMSYSRIPQLSPSDFVPYSLHGAIQFAAYSAIRSRTTNRMPYPDIIMESPSSVDMLFHFCRITHNACRLRLPRIWNPSLRKNTSHDLV